jgi:hypothetical protein
MKSVGNCVNKTQLFIIVIGVCGEGGRLTTIAPNLQASLGKMLLSCALRAKIGPKPRVQYFFEGLKKSIQMKHISLIVWTISCF